MVIGGWLAMVPELVVGSSSVESPKVVVRDWSGMITRGGVRKLVDERFKTLKQIP